MGNLSATWAWILSTALLLPSPHALSGHKESQKEGHSQCKKIGLLVEFPYSWWETNTLMERDLTSTWKGRVFAWATHSDRRSPGHAKKIPNFVKKPNPKLQHVQLFSLQTVHSLKRLLEVEGANTSVLHLIWQMGKSSQRCDSNPTSGILSLLSDQRSIST